MGYSSSNHSSHNGAIDEATIKSKPEKVKISDIDSVGHPMTAYADQEKIKRMRHQLRKGKHLPPVRLVVLNEALRDKYGIDDPTKKFYLENGHHRFAASKLEHKHHIRAVEYHKGKRL